jgi:hypothetical protein
VRRRQHGTKREEFGTNPSFSSHLILYHTHVCHSELSGEYPGQSDPSSLTISFYGCFGLSGSLGPINGLNETNQTDQT